MPIRASRPADILRHLKWNLIEHGQICCARSVFRRTNNGGIGYRHKSAGI
jgi:hypothetical protein